MNVPSTESVRTDLASAVEVTLDRNEVYLVSEYFLSKEKVVWNSRVCNRLLTLPKSKPSLGQVGSGGGRNGCI